MEVLNPIEGKTYKLPVGYRFDPTDGIFGGYYLRKRIMGQQLPNDLIQDFDVYQTVPWELPGGGNKYLNFHRFFFYNMRTRVFDNLDKREAGNGQWRTVERDQEVVLSNEQLIGKKTVLAFWEAKGNRFAKTNWMMHEFRLALKSHPSQLSDVSACRIFEMKKEGRRGKRSRVYEEKTYTSNKEEEATAETPSVIDFKEESGTTTGPPSPVASETS